MRGLKLFLELILRKRVRFYPTSFTDPPDNNVIERFGKTALNLLVLAGEDRDIHQGRCPVPALHLPVHTSLTVKNDSLPSS